VRSIDLAIGLGFLAGALVTAAAAVVVGSLAGWLPAPARLGAAGAAVVLLAAREAGLARFVLPERRRLIPSPRLDLPFPWGTAAFAAELGLGWRTAVPTSAPYGLLVVVALAASMPAGAVAAAGWALGRAVPVAVATRRRAADGSAMPAWPFPGGRPVALAALAALLAAVVAAVAGVP
jgi:hypothetical protein